MGIIESIKMKMKMRGALRDAQSYATALTSLSTLLFTVAYKCTEACKQSIDDKFGKDTNEAKFIFLRVFYEYIYFLLHVADRMVLSGYGPAIRARFQEELYPLVQKGSTEAFCAHWPDEIKARINADFVDNINSANNDYASCKSVYNQEAPLAVSSLIGKLGQRISMVLELKDLSLSVVSTMAGMQALSLMNLKVVLADVCKRL